MIVLQHADTKVIHAVHRRDRAKTKCGLAVQSHTWIARPSSAWLTGGDHRCGNCERCF